jgi:hypothetical protein
VTPVRLAAEYVLPLRWTDGRELADLVGYLSDLVGWLDVTVVDGSPEPYRARHAAVFPDGVRHRRPEPWPGVNGKVAGVVTGVRAARHEWVVVADDDVRWSADGLRRVVDLLHRADLVRPQNVFRPAPWHARWDTGRILLNRALGADYPGTYGLRRSTFLGMGGYSGDALFENLELGRTVRAAGGRELTARDLFVDRRPPTTRHFLGQRVRQAYDDLAQPARLLIEASLLPGTLAALWWGRRPPRRRRLALAATSALAGTVALAEIGRRRAGGRAVFPGTAALWAPLWLAERAVAVWWALGCWIRGGVPYGGRRIRLAAHRPSQLRGRARLSAPP